MRGELAKVDGLVWIVYVSWWLVGWRVASPPAEVLENTVLLSLSAGGDCSQTHSLVAMLPSQLLRFPTNPPAPTPARS